VHEIICLHLLVYYPNTEAGAKGVNTHTGISSNAAVSLNRATQPQIQLHFNPINNFGQDWANSIRHNGISGLGLKENGVLFGKL
jgi:hypothetical protein